MGYTETMASPFSSAMVAAQEERLALSLPRSYLEALENQGLVFRQWRFHGLDELVRLDSVFETARVGVVIAVHRDGYVSGTWDVPQLCLLAGRDAPRVLRPAVHRRTPGGRLRRLAPSLAALFATERLPSLSALERERGPRRAPPEAPPSDASSAIYARLLEIGQPGVSERVRAARGDAGDYLRLVYTRGPLSRAYLAWKLNLPEPRVAEIAAEVAALLGVTPAG